MIPIYKPFWPEKSKYFAQKALDDGWLTNHQYNIDAERQLAHMLNVRHVLLTCNGTAATHLVAKGLKFKHPEVNKIIVPNIVYVAAWNSFLFDKEYDLYMARTNAHTWNFDLKHVKELATENSAILAVHNVGNPVNVPWLKRNVGVPIVEDACEALFGRYGGHVIPTWSLVASLSFFGNKNITSGEGGAVVTNDDELADYLKKLRGQGQTHRRYIHDELGYNYRMTNVQAGILLGQLDCLTEIQERKNNIWERYNKAFAESGVVVLQTVLENDIRSDWMYAVSLPSRPEPFDEKYEHFKKLGVEIRPMFYPMHYHTHLNLNSRVHMTDDNVGEEISKTTIMIPSYPDLTAEEQDRVISAVLGYAL